MLASPEGDLFSDWLEDLRVRELRKLKEGLEVHAVYRAQGSVGILDVVLRIKEDLRRYEQDVMSGKANRIEEVPDGLVGQNQR